MIRLNRNWALIALVLTTCLVTGMACAADAPALPGAPQAYPQPTPPAAQPPAPQPLNPPVAASPVAPQQPAPPVAGPAPAQPKPAMEKLDTLAKKIERAQQCSPEVLIAEAQLREAEARLQQARLQAAERVTQGHFDGVALGKMRDSVGLLEERVKVGTATSQELLAAEAQLTQLEADLAKQKAFLQAISTPLPSSAPAPFAANQAPARGKLIQRPQDMPEEIMKRLQNPIKDPLTGTLTMEDVGNYLSEQFSLNTVIDVQLADSMVSVNLTDTSMTLQGLLSAVADSAKICFVVRDYGVYVTSREEAMTINAPTIPWDIPLYDPPAGTPSADPFAR